MWEGLQMGVAYLNEELGMPVRMCTGEGGCPPRLLRSRFLKYVILQIASGYFGWDEIIHAIPGDEGGPLRHRDQVRPGRQARRRRPAHVVQGQQADRRHPRRAGRASSLPSPPTHQTQYSIEESVAKMIQSMYMAWGFRVPVYPKISGTSTALAVLNNLTRNPYAAGLAIDGEDGGTGAAYNVSMNHMGHPIASNIRDGYLNLVKLGKQNEIPLFAGGGVGKNRQSGRQRRGPDHAGGQRGPDRQVHHAGGGRLPGLARPTAATSATSACAPRASPPRIRASTAGWTSEQVAERVVDVFLGFDTELKKIVAPLGRSTSLPIGMSDALGIDDYRCAERLSIKYVV